MNKFMNKWIDFSLMDLWIVFVVWLTNERRLALFPGGTIIRDPHHRECPTRLEQGLNMRRAWVQA